jgi:hypothetical protein
VVKRENQATRNAAPADADAVGAGTETDSGRASGKAMVGSFVKTRLVGCTEGGRSKGLFEDLVSSSVVAVNWKPTAPDEESNVWMPGVGAHLEKGGCSRTASCWAIPVRPSSFGAWRAAGTKTYPGTPMNHSNVQVCIFFFS